MALNGEGEPQPTLLQVATQAATIELFTQWQTYRNGVHWDYDSFRSVDFRAIAIAVLTAAGFEITENDITDMPKLRKLLAQPGPFDSVKDSVATAIANARERNAESQRPYGLPVEAIAEHGKQVQG